jgi:hypothetical protein
VDALMPPADLPDLVLEIAAKTEFRHARITAALHRATLPAAETLAAANAPIVDYHAKPALSERARS